MSKDPSFDNVVSEIEKDQHIAAFNGRKRRRLLTELESLSGQQDTRVIVYVAQPSKAVSRYDVLPFSQLLRSVGTAQNLDFVIQSPGGDGTAAETMLDLCRKHCHGTLRVVVPMFAKSAATLIALGADEIVMGETSELGPIDAQILIMQDGSEQQVSADHFLRARSTATLQLGSSDPEEKESGQIQLSLLSPAFLQFCEDAMKFGFDFGEKQLRAHMFAAEYATDPTSWNARIGNIVKNLTSSSQHLTHGRMITASGIKNDPDLKHLKIKELGSDDPYWTKLTEFLLRTEIVMQKLDIGKLMMSKNFDLFGA